MTQQDRTAVQYHKMTETPIPRLILSLAAPTILSMLITSIYNLADTFFVGRISTSASGAVGVVSSLMAIIQALGFMLGHGSGTIISRRLGSQDTHAATRFASTSFFTALAFGVVLAVVGLATLPDFMMLLGSTETILPHACAYARPILLAAPLMISSLVMNNILRYEGKANLAMVGLVTGGLLNIALDPLFMFALGLGTAGAGIATALSQTISFGILLYMFLRGKTVSQFRLSAVTREPREFLQILAGGAPSFGRQGLNSIGGMLLNIAARSYGDAAVAGMSIVSRIFMFILSVAIGVGQGLQPVASFNYGARKYHRVRQAAVFTLQAAFVLLVVLIAAVLVLRAVLGGKKAAGSTYQFVRTSTLQKTSLTDSVSVNGTVKSGYEASVTVADSAKLYKVSEVKVAVGDTVKKGDVIATLDTSDLEKQIESVIRAREKITGAPGDLKDTKVVN